MRRLLGPLVLAVLVAISLWFLQSSRSASTLPAPSATGNETSTSPSTSPHSGTSPRPPLASPPPATATSTSSSTSASSPAPAVIDGDGVPIDPSAPATPRDHAQAQYLARYTDEATRFMTAFARPSPSQPAEQWWPGVLPHLTSTAAADYAGTDPRQVPFTRLTGPAVVIPTDAPSSLLVAVRVPTDAGDYRVELQTDPDGIRVARAFPEQAGTSR